MGNLKFAKKEKNEEVITGLWKVLIVDDEPSIHTMTKTVLSNFILDGKKLEFISVYNGEDAIKVLEETNDIALILLDVVMETDDAGLIVAKKIREELDNQMVRIILRTGQPGTAPEEEVIIKYRINDYKEKTELTAKKLFSTIVTAIRSYQDLETIKKSKDGLEKIIVSTKSILEEKSLEMFAQGVLTQLISILNLNNDSFIINTNSGLSIEKSYNNFEILAATGVFEGEKKFDNISPSIKELIYNAINNEKSTFLNDDYIGYFKFNDNVSYLVYISGCKNINIIDRNLTEIFSNNISVAFNNLSLHNEVLDTQKEIIEKLGEVVERRSNEASKHVHRVAEFSYVLAKNYGLSDDEATLLRLASPMHDVGKIGIRDNILLKPGKLTPEEFEIMKTHATIGYEILKSSNREILKAAAILAYEHHEKWDGTGYPNEKKGDDIHIFGRITALADVFDALYHKRCYKEAWPLENIIDLLIKEKGKQFDPSLVDLVLDNIDTYVKITQDV